MNKFKKVYLEKVVLNICVGNDPDRLEKSKKVLSLIGSGRVPKSCFSKKVIKNFGIKKNNLIGYKITFRNDWNILEKCLETRQNNLQRYLFDERGNFSFGIENHTFLEGIPYDSSLGIFGLDVCVSFYKKGKRIQLRKKNRFKFKQKTSFEEVIVLLKERFLKLKLIE